MSKRKSVTVLGWVVVILSVFSVLLFICYFARHFGMKDFATEMVNAVKNAFSYFGKFEQENLPYSIGIIALSVISGLFFISWICVGIKRKRFIFLLGIIALALNYVILITNVSFSKELFDNISKGNVVPMDVVEFALCVISFVFVVIFHFSDMFSGKSNEVVVTETNRDVSADEVKEEIKQEINNDPKPVQVDIAGLPEGAVVESTTTTQGDANTPTQVTVNIKLETPVNNTPAEAEVKDNKEEDIVVEKKKAAKKAPAKKAPAKKAAPAKKPAKKVEKADNTKVYHVSKRASDGLWVVKFAGGEKVIKTFKTKQEAVDWTDVVAKNQDGVVLTHASKGAKQGKINAKRSPLKD